MLIITILFLAQLIIAPPLSMIVGTGLVLCLQLGFGIYILIGTESKLVLANSFIGFSLLVLAFSFFGILIYNSSKISIWLIIMELLIFLVTSAAMWLFVYKKCYLNYKDSIRSNRKALGYVAFIGVSLGTLFYRSIMKNLSDNIQFLIFNLLCLLLLLMTLYGAIFYLHRYYRLSKIDSWRYQIIYDED